MLIYDALTVDTQTHMTTLTCDNFAWFLENNGLFVQVLISRNYRGDIPMSEIDHFMPLITEVIIYLFKAFEP